LLLIFIYLANRKLKILSFASLVLGGVILLHFQTAFAETSRQKLIIFAVPKSSVWGIFENGSAVIISDSAFSKNKAAINFNLEPTLLQNQTKMQQIISWDQAQDHIRQLPGKAIFIWHGKSILILQKPPLKDLHNPVLIDYLVLQNNVWVKPEKLKQNFRFRKIILDSSNAAWYRKWLTPKLQAVGITVYDVNVEGAFELQL
jgi:competence protein ComEC